VTPTVARTKIYTVVEVWRGMARSARTFRWRKDAEKYMQRLKRLQNPVEDDVQMFATVWRFSR